MSESQGESGTTPARAPVKKNAAFAVEYALLASDTEAAQQHADRLQGLLGAIAQTEVNILRKRDTGKHTATLDNALPGLVCLIRDLVTKPEAATSIVKLVRNTKPQLDTEIADYLLAMALNALVTHNKAHQAQRLAYGDNLDAPIDLTRGVRWSCAAAKALLAANKPKRALAAISPLPEAFPEARPVLMDIRGQIYLQQGNKHAAALDFLHAIDADPLYAPPLWWLAFIIWSDIAVRESLEVIERVIKQGRPHHSRLNSILADLYAMTDQVELAKPIYRAAAKARILESRPALAELQWPDHSPSKPDFIIIGAPKCGTTSAFNYLHGHPKVLSPSTKEITFFNDDRRYALGTDWYLSQFPSLAGSNGYISGEATPGYFFSDVARQRIKENFPGTRLILFLRDPAVRAISAYYQQVKMGKPQPPIGDFFHGQLARQAATAPEGDSQSVLGKGIYHLQVQPWLESFGPQGLLIIKAEDFFAKPHLVMREIFEYLGLEDVRHPQYPVLNKGLYPQAPDDLIKELGDYFRPHNEVFYRLTGRDFNW